MNRLESRLSPSNKGERTVNSGKHCTTFLLLLLSMACASARHPRGAEVGIRFHLNLEFLRCETMGLAVRCINDRDYRESVFLEWFDTSRGWQSETFPNSVVPREVVCSETVRWLLFRTSGSEVIWLSARDKLPSWKGCKEESPGEVFYAPLMVAPAGPWIQVAKAEGADFVGIRASANAEFFRPVPEVPVSVLTEQGDEEPLCVTDAFGICVFSKEALSSRHATYILLNPTHQYERVAVPVSEILQRGGSFVREVRLAYVAFY